LAAAQQGSPEGQISPLTRVEHGWSRDTYATLMLFGLHIYPGWTHVPAGGQLLSRVHTDCTGRTGLPIP